MEAGDQGGGGGGGGTSCTSTVAPRAASCSAGQGRVSPLKTVLQGGAPALNLFSAFEDAFSVSSLSLVYRASILHFRMERLFDG